MVHLCPRNAATWRNRPHLPSKACKLTVALAYSAAGQAASALHAMAILQVYQAKALKQVHKGSTDPGLMQELHMVTDFALRATKVTAWSLGKPSLAQPGRDERRRQGMLSRRPHLPGRAVWRHRKDFAQQFSMVQQQTEAIQHILPRHDAPTTTAPGNRPQSARHHGRPPASSRAAPPCAESTPRVPARPQVVQEVDQANPGSASPEPALLHYSPSSGDVSAFFLLQFSSPDGEPWWSSSSTPGSQTGQSSLTPGPVLVLARPGLQSASVLG